MVEKVEELGIYHPYYQSVIQKVPSDFQEKTKKAAKFVLQFSNMVFNTINIYHYLFNTFQFFFQKRRVFENGKYLEPLLVLIVEHDVLNKDVIRV